MRSWCIVIWIAYLSTTIGALDLCHKRLLQNDDSTFQMVNGNIQFESETNLGVLRSNNNLVFPNVKFACKGTVSSLLFLAALHSSLSDYWMQHVSISVSLWTKDFNPFNLEPYSVWEDTFTIDLLELNSAQNIHLQRTSPGSNRFHIDPNITSFQLYTFEVDVNVQVQAGDMIGLSLPKDLGAAVHVVYDRTAFDESSTKSACTCVLPHSLDGNESSIWKFVSWQPILGISFTEAESTTATTGGVNSQIKGPVGRHEAAIIVLSLVLLAAFILILVLVAVIINLRAKLKIFVNFAQISSRNPNSMGRALPIPMSSRRSTQHSSTIYSELDDITLKRLGKTYSNAVYARNPFTCGASTLDVIEEFDDAFCSPADTEDDLYEQLSNRDIEHFTKSLIILGDKVGEGEFGCVHRGKCKGLEYELAIKMSKEPQGNVPLLQEAVILGQFRHPGIIQLFGLVTVTDPIMLVMEYLPNGNLSQHLQQQAFYEGAAIQRFLPHTLLRFCTEICDGLNYLSKKGFIHRDLAARNILLDKDYHCKIADFGMSRHLEENSYYITKGGRIPLKWTAPEAILYRKYSSKSDVWSYGMVMYEIWSLGRKPFEDFSPEEIMKILNTGYCQPPPANCPREAYQLMVDCWNPQHHSRPEFSVISGCLNRINLDQCTEDFSAGQSSGENEVTFQYYDLQFRYKSNSDLTEALS